MSRIARGLMVAIAFPLIAGVARAQDYQRQLAESLAFEGRYLTAIALLGWAEGNEGRDLVILAPPARKQPLVRGLALQDLAEALRGEVFRRYQLSYRLSIGKTVYEDDWPQTFGVPTTSRVDAAVTYRLGTMQAGEKTAYTTSTRTVTYVDRAGVERSEAALAGLGEEAEKLLQRLRGVQLRLDEVESQLARPEMTVTMGAERETGVSRRVETCERDRSGGSTLKCTARYEKVTITGPATASSGRTTWESAALRDEQRALVAERDALRDSLSAVAKRAGAVAGAKPPTVSRQVTTRRPYQVRTLSGEANAVVKLKLDGKPLPGFDFTLPISLEGPMVKEGAVLDALLERAVYEQARGLLQSRLLELLQSRVPRMADTVYARSFEKDLVETWAKQPTSRDIILKSEYAVKHLKPHIYCLEHAERESCFTWISKVP
jgi:hypothetical protein